MRVTLAATALSILLATTALAVDEHCFTTWAYVGGDVAEGDVSPVPLREIWVDSAPFTGVPGGGMVTYDREAALRELTVDQLAQEPEWVVGVRLVLSEVGPDRLLDNRWGLVEAIAILQTVHNRLAPEVWNPAGIEGVRPWPGCGDGGTFVTCANPRQYLGLATRRALAPRSTVLDRARLQRAADLAVSAWWLTETGAVGDVTNGATSFVHRCGGRAYGEPTTSCDGSASTPDVAGAVAAQGPLVLKGPTVFLRRSGRYRVEERRQIDYVEGPGLREPGVAARYLWGVAPVDPGTTSTGEG